MNDSKLFELNRFLRRHKFFARSSFARFTSSERRAFEREVCFFAKTLNLSEKVAKEELSKARQFCREDWSDSDESAWFNEVDDSSDIPASRGSRATGLTIAGSTEAELSLLQSLPMDGKNQRKDLPPGFSNSRLGPNLRSPLPKERAVSKDRASKKRKLEQADAKHDEAKQTVTKSGSTRHAKKAKLQLSEAGDCENTIPATQASTSSIKTPNSTVENEVPKPRKKKPRKKEGAKTQRPEEIINQTSVEFSQGAQDSSNHTSPASTEEQPNTNTSRSSETVESEREKASDRIAEISNGEGATRSTQNPPPNEIKQSSRIDKSLKLGRKEAKKASRKEVKKAMRKEARQARQEMARGVGSVKEECKAKSSGAQLLSDDNDPQAITILEIEQDLHAPQDFHSPMIQSVRQPLMRRSPIPIELLTMKGNESPILESYVAYQIRS